MTESVFLLAGLIGLLAWFCAASDAYDQRPEYGLVLLLAPGIYWTYALAYPRRPRALASLALTIAAIALLFFGPQLGSH